MELIVVQIEKPEAVNLILGQSHFVKTVEDLHEALVGSVPGIKFGLAFCESSGPALVRASGSDDELIELAKRNALALSAGHSFIIFLGEGFYPVNVLNAIKMVPLIRDLSVIRQFSGLRPMPRDGLPFIGPIPHVPGYYIAVGHSGNTLSPIHGQIMSDLIVEGETSIPLDDYDPLRYDERGTRKAGPDRNGHFTLEVEQ